MFSSEYFEEEEQKFHKKYNGVDLSNCMCVKLKKTPLYDEYQKDDIHYIVDAVQKGLKPYTLDGLRRVKRKNANKLNKLKMQKKTKTEAQAPPLLPQSPEALCMKALRANFLSTFKEHKKAVSHSPFMKKNQSIEKTSKIMKRKLHQRKRRNELIRLVKEYRDILQPYFGARLIGYGRCPKVSRQEIKDFLIKKSIVPDIGPEKFNPKLTPYDMDPSQQNQESQHIQELNDKIEHGLKIDNLNYSPWIDGPLVPLKPFVLNEDDFPSLLGQQTTSKTINPN